MKMKYKYEIIIYWSNEDNSYIAEAPELPGCMSDGETYQQALSNIEKTIDEWIETAKNINKKIPSPKGKKLMFA